MIYQFKTEIKQMADGNEIDVLAILDAVAAPLDPEDIKIRHDKDRDLRYIDARVVINRLNRVAPGLWSSYVQDVKQGSDGKYYAIGTLTICGITHGECGVSETDKYFDPPKAAVSDLLKRCAVRFGMGIELYGDDDQRPVGTGESGSKPKPTNRPATPPKPPTNSPAAQRLQQLTDAAQGTKLTRPWVPARLKQQVALKISKSQLTGAATASQQGKLAGSIDALFDQQEAPDKWRHSLMMILIGKDSVKDATKAEASVLIEWADKDPEKAATEAYLAINIALEEAGQQRLPGA